MKVFISHSSRDRWVASRIAGELEIRGIETFLDEKDLLTGESLDSAIINHLSDCQHLLVLVSPPALRSQWVLFEVGAARANGVSVIPILLHVGANELPSMLANKLARDINDIDRYIEEVVELQNNDHEGIGAGEPTKPLDAQEPVFEIGDRVRTLARDELAQNELELPPTYTADMGKFGERKAKILRIEERKNAPGGRVYNLDIDDGKFVWIGTWLEEIRPNDDL